MEIRKKNDTPRVQPDLKEHREKLVADGQDRLQDARESTRAFAERTKQVAERTATELIRSRDTVDISAGASRPEATETGQTRREYVNSLRERYAAGVSLVTPEMSERAAENILREPS